MDCALGRHIIEPQRMNKERGNKASAEFADYTSLCGAVDMLEGRDAIQKDLDRLVRWARSNLTRFNKAKCKVLHLSQGNRKHKCRVGGEWTESSPAKKDLRMLVDEKLSMTR